MPGFRSRRWPVVATRPGPVATPADICQSGGGRRAAFVRRSQIRPTMRSPRSGLWFCPRELSRPPPANVRRRAPAFRPARREDLERTRQIQRRKAEVNVEADLFRFHQRARRRHRLRRTVVAVAWLLQTQCRTRAAARRVVGRKLRWPKVDCNAVRNRHALLNACLRSTAWSRQSQL
jgi:hypothetical protein